MGTCTGPVVEGSLTVSCASR